MKNPKTTCSGYLLILAAIMSTAAKLMVGNLPDMTDGAMLIAGISAICAKDGGH